jgi:hypothetical protein
VARKNDSDTTPVTIYDNDLGVDVEFMAVKCPMCGDKTKQGNTLLIYDIRKTADYYCMVCGFKETKEPFMKEWVKRVESQREKQKRFPDEDMHNTVDWVKSYVSTEVLEGLMSLVHDKETANMFRRTKTYKRCPKSMTDNDRLLWTIRRLQIVACTSNMSIKEFKEVMKEEEERA